MAGRALGPSQGRYLGTVTAIDEDRHCVDIATAIPADGISRLVTFRSPAYSRDTAYRIAGLTPLPGGGTRIDIGEQPILLGQGRVHQVCPGNLIPATYPRVRPASWAVPPRVSSMATLPHGRGIETTIRHRRMASPCASRSRARRGLPRTTSCSTTTSALVTRPLSTPPGKAGSRRRDQAADHGNVAGDHGIHDKDIGIYESIHRMPFIASCPGCRRGAWCDGIVEEVPLSPPLVLGVLAGELFPGPRVAVAPEALKVFSDLHSTHIGRQDSMSNGTRSPATRGVRSTVQVLDASAPRARRVGTDAHAPHGRQNAGAICSTTGYPAGERLAHSVEARPVFDLAVAGRTAQISPGSGPGQPHRTSAACVLDGVAVSAPVDHSPTSRFQP